MEYFSRSTSLFPRMETLLLRPPAAGRCVGVGNGRTAARQFHSLTPAAASRRLTLASTPPEAAQSERERGPQGVKGHPAAASPPGWRSLVSTPPQRTHSLLGRRGSGIGPPLPRWRGGRPGRLRRNLTNQTLETSCSHSTLISDRQRRKSSRMFCRGPRTL